MSLYCKFPGEWQWTNVENRSNKQLQTPANGVIEVESVCGLEDGNRNALMKIETFHEHPSCVGNRRIVMQRSQTFAHYILHGVTTAYSTVARSSVEFYTLVTKNAYFYACITLRMILMTILIYVLYNAPFSVATTLSNCGCCHLQ